MYLDSKLIIMSHFHNSCKWITKDYRRHLPNKRNIRIKVGSCNHPAQIFLHYVLAYAPQFFWDAKNFVRCAIHAQYMCNTFSAIRCDFPFSSSIGPSRLGCDRGMQESRKVFSLLFIKQYLQYMQSDRRAFSSMDGFSNAFCSSLQWICNTL